MTDPEWWDDIPGWPGRLPEGEGLIVTDRFSIRQRRALRQRKRVIRDPRQPDRVRYGLIDLADESRRDARAMMKPVAGGEPVTADARPPPERCGATGCA
jgi:hypothetical protein